MHPGALQRQDVVGAVLVAVGGFQGGEHVVVLGHELRGHLMKKKL